MLVFFVYPSILKFFPGQYVSDFDGEGGRWVEERGQTRKQWV